MVIRHIVPVLLFSCLLLSSCNKITPEMRALEGSYSGRIYLVERNWHYNEGVGQQDTLFEENIVDTAMTLVLKDGEYTVGQQTGSYFVKGDSMALHGENLDCLGDPRCTGLSNGFYGYFYQFEQAGDSLILRFDLEGESQAFGNYNRTKTYMRRRLRFRLE